MARNVEAFLGIYGNVGWLFQVVSRIAEAVASTEWRLYRSGAERIAIEAHPALDLWHSVNPFYTRGEFVETFQQHLDLTGEAWWVLVRNSGGQIRELWPVRPDRIRPIPHPVEYIVGYEYRLGSNVIPLERDDVIFLRRPNPLDPYRGMGPVQSILADLDSERFTALWNRNFFINSAEPGGIIEFDRELSDAEFEKKVMRWRTQHQGVAQAHRVGVLERGKWVDRKFSMRDMQFEQMRRVNRDIILGAFGFPKHILGASDDVNRANAQGAEIVFSRWLLRPRLERIRGALNERLLPHFGEGLEFDFIDPTPEDRELAIREAEVGAATFSLTQNEIRRRLGEADTEDGDEVVIPPTPVASSQALLKQPQPPETPRDIATVQVDMADAWETRLAEELAGILGFLTEAKGRKIEMSDVDGYSWDWWARYGEEVTEELARAFTISLTFSGAELGPAQAQLMATQFAEARGARLLRLDGDLNMVTQTRERVRHLVGETIREGESLQMLRSRIQDDFVFSRSRAEMVARTETTTALGQGSRAAALSQGQDEKRWVTQGDGNVTVECSSNEGADWIPIGDAFPSGVDTVPQHPRCRCNVIYRHRPVEGMPVAEARCPDCGKLVGKNVSRGTVLWCRRCKQQVVVLTKGVVANLRALAP